MSPPRSSLARMQQFLTLGLLAAALGWLAWFWDRSVWLACAGFVLVAVAYSGFLALEFLALHFVNRNHTAVQPTWPELARAWLGESLQGPRVFCWRQPFRWRAVPDRVVAAPELRGRRGVVFIHGFVCNRGFWTPWLRELERSSHAFSAVNLEPVFGSIDDYAPIIDRAVEAVTQACGMPPLLVCHSMGGLAARAWLRAGPGAAAHHIVTIGTPHGGTWLAQFSRAPSARQMAVGSDWLRALDAQRTRQPETGFTCWYSNCDNIVFPASGATLRGADNRLVRGVAHVDLAFQPEVIAATLALLGQD